MKTVDLIIQNCCIVTMDKKRRVLEDASAAVLGRHICAVGAKDEIAAQYEAKRVIDGTNKILFPGLVNTHDHLFQVLVKGLGRDVGLMDWLMASVRPAICQIGSEEARLAAEIGLMEQISAGVTTCVDYQYAHGKPGVDQAVLDAMDHLGVRGVLARGFTRTENFPKGCRCDVNETEDDMLDAAEELWEKYRGHERLSIQMAPAIVWDFSDESFRRMRETANRTGMRITMHTAETTLDNEYCMEHFGVREVPYLESLGILGPDFLAVHCVDLNDNDLELFRKYDVKVSYNSLSNMILGYDVTPVVAMREKGITVSLALDGPGTNDNQNMLEALKSTSLVQKTHHRSPKVMSAAEVLEMATIDGAKAIGLEDEIGSIEVGKRADFFLFDPMHFNSVPIADPIATLVYTGCEHNIALTAVDGKVIYENGIFPGVDTQEVMREVQKAGAGIRDKAGLGSTQWGQKLSLGEFR